MAGTFFYYLKLEDKVTSSLGYFIAMGFKHSRLISKALSKETKDRLKLVPVHRISNEHQSFPSQSHQKVGCIKSELQVKR